MKRQLIALLASAAFQASTGAPALAHHSFAMFDSNQKMTLSAPSRSSNGSICTHGST